MPEQRIVPTSERRTALERSIEVVQAEADRVLAEAARFERLYDETYRSMSSYKAQTDHLLNVVARLEKDNLQLRGQLSDAQRRAQAAGFPRIAQLD